MILENLTKEELLELKDKVQTRLNELEEINNNEYEFDFEVKNDPRKGIPYVAKMILGNNDLEREFFDLNKQYGKKEVLVYGKFKAKEGDIIEMREGGSWKNDYRTFYLIKDGKLENFGYTSSASDKLKVIKYLKELKC